MTRVNPAPALVTATRQWRMRAVQLAVEHNLVGQVRKAETPDVYHCISASEPDDHTIGYDLDSGAIACDCKAGLNLTPCGHAGATLLFIVGCAPERERDAMGYVP